METKPTSRIVGAIKSLFGLKAVAVPTAPSRPIHNQGVDIPWQRPVVRTMRYGRSALARGAFGNGQQSCKRHRYCYVHAYTARAHAKPAKTGPKAPR